MFKIPVVTGIGRIPRDQLDNRGRPTTEDWGETKRKLESNLLYKDLDDYLHNNAGAFKETLDKENHPTEITEEFNWEQVLSSPATMPADLVPSKPDKPRKAVTFTGLGKGKPALELYRSKLDLTSEETTKEGENPQEESQKKKPWKKPRADTPWHTQTMDACKRPDTPRPDTHDETARPARACTVEECPEVEFVEERKISRKPSPPRSPPTPRRYVEYSPDRQSRAGKKRPQSHRRGRGDSSEREEKRSWRTERKESRARTPQRSSRPRHPDRNRREHRSQDYKPRHLSTSRRR